MDLRFTDAASKGDVDLLENFIVLKGYDVNLTDSQGYTALHAAVREGQLEAAMYLIEQGANVDECDTDGYTALHEAATLGNEDLVILLLSNGADKSLHTAEGFTALDISVRYGYGTITYALCEGHTPEEGFF